jgi:hypothetical protein
VPLAGGCSIPYAARPISEAGKARIGAAAKAHWERYRRDKAAGGPVGAPVLGRPRKPVARAEAPSAFWQETEAKAKERRRLYLQKRYPDRGLLKRNCPYF